MMNYSLSKVKAWIKDERSAAQTSETGMLMLGGIIVAVGLGFLIAQYMKSTGDNVLGRMENISQTGFGPQTPPPLTGGGSEWQKTPPGGF